MGSLQPIRELSLYYMDTQEYKIESQLGKEISNVEYSIFGFVLKGSVKIALEVGNHRRSGKVTYGEVFYLPPNCRCTIQNRDKQPSRLIMIRFQCEERAHHSASSRQSVPFAMINELQLYHFRMPRIRNWVQDLLNDGLQQEPSRHYLVYSYLYAIAAEFMAFIERPKAAEDELIDYVVQIKQDMLEHCSAAIDIEEVARLSGSSPARFYQVFKQLTGLSPLKFMTMTRLNESLHLLANNPSSIMDVAHSSGYLDELYFSRLFKKHMGISPTQYASAAKLRVANLCPVFQGDLSVLGITPVLELQREWYSDLDKDKYVKQIEQCQPELILTAPVEENLYKRLSQICPVVMIHWKGYSWKERLLEISRIIRIPTVAERWLSYFQMKVENARAHIRRQLEDKPFLVVSVFERFFRVHGMQRIKMKDLFYDELQITPPASAYPISFLDVSILDELASMDCDHILFLVPASFSDESCIMLEENWSELKRNRRRKHCIFIRHEEPLMYNASFYESLIDQFVNYLIVYR